MTSFFRLRNFILILLLATLALPALGQKKDRKDRPDQLDILKINISQFFINSARMTYEHELAYDLSLEVGAGFLYPNNWWVYQGGSRFYGSGYEGQIGIRKYFEKKRFFFPTFFRSYLMPVVYYRYTAYDPLWVLYGRGLALDSAFCWQQTEKFHSGGLRIIFGFQTRAGRSVMDMYAGLGLKYTWNSFTQLAENSPGEPCGIGPTTRTMEETSTRTDWEATIHVGLKLGLRLSNKRRTYHEKPETDVKWETPDFD